MAMRLSQGYSAQHCLLVMVEKWRQCLDIGGVSGALLTDLSKVLDCILHGLLIAKLSVFGFDYNSCKCCKATSQKTENKKQKLMMRIVKFCSEFHKVLYQGRCYLIFIYVTCYMILMIAILRVILMIILHLQVAAIQTH